MQTTTVPERTTVRAFWNLIQSHLDTLEFAPSGRQLADRLGVAPQTLTNWKAGLTELPKRKNLEAVAAFIGKPYGYVLLTALNDTGYGHGAKLTVRQPEPRKPAKDVEIVETSTTPLSPTD